MVSEIPVVRVAADASSSSSTARDSKPFTNKSISIRLDETNYLLWRQQVLFTIESLDLSSHIDGTSVVPSQYVLVNSEKVPNPHYASFKQQDSALCSWLVASISLSILPSLVSCRTAFEIWEKVQQIFSVSSTTKIMHLHCSLKNLRKRDQGMREYLAQIQSVCDSLAACGNPLSETMHISAILYGLPSDYEPVVANSSLGYDGYQFSSSRGPNMFVDQAYYPFMGQVSSGAPISVSQKAFSDSGPYSQRMLQDSSFSQRGFQNPSLFRGSGFQFGRSFSRGRGRFFGGRARPQCQLCGRIGHLVNRCYYRFDRSYDGYSVNLVEEVVDCPKSEGESFHQEGVVAFVSEDFSPVVCEDAASFPDSGATAHLTPDLGKFHSSSPYIGSGKIIVANGMVVPISRIGNSSLATDSRSLFLSNLLHVPCVNKNLLSVSQFTKDNNVYVEFFPNSCVVKDLGTQQVMLRGLESNGLYKFFSKQEDIVQQTVGSSENYQDSVSSVSCSKLNSIVAKSVASVFSISDVTSLPQQQAEFTSLPNQQAESLSNQHDESLPNQQAESFPNQQTESASLPSQQAVFCFHQEPSTCFSQTSSSPGVVQQLSTNSLHIHGSQVSSKESSVSQSSSEVSQGSSSSLASNIKVGCHPMLTRSKTGSLKSKVCFSDVASVEVSEPKTVQQAFESKEWSDVVHKEYDALSFMSHASIPSAMRDARGLTEDLVGISVGIEDVNDLIADLDDALRTGPL
ncbi:hypothetical protein GQ457_14G022540 [Hibiscus cannabinus]